MKIFEHVSALIDWSSTWKSQNRSVAAFMTSSVSVFVPAWLAFRFGLKQYQRQKENENLGYLQYAISILASTVSHLYCFKKDLVVERYKEAHNAGLQMGYMSKNSASVLDLQFKHMFLYLHEPENQWPISLEKLYFLTSRDPNLVSILGAASRAVATLNSIVKGINATIEKCMAGDERPEHIVYLVSNTKILKHQTDDTLYLVEKSLALLVKYGHLEFGNRMKAESCDITDESFKELKPIPISSWENGEWFPKKRRWWSKPVRQLNQWFKGLSENRIVFARGYQNLMRRIFERQR